MTLLIKQFVKHLYLYSMKKEDIDINVLLDIAKAKKYVILENPKKPFLLNIWNIRSTNSNPTEYDDFGIVFRKAHKPNNPTIDTPNYIRRYQSGWVLDIFDITTNPGLPYLLQPMNPKGAAIVVPGQYLSVFKKGLHHGEYPALVQCAPITVVRDNNKNSKLDYDGEKESGMFGINYHRGSKFTLSKIIGKNSAGCQVHMNTKYFEEIFMWLIDESIKNGYEYFGLTLIEQIDYEKYK